jgi:hypothetical protein
MPAGVAWGIDMRRNTSKTLARTHVQFLSGARQAALSAVPRDDALGSDTYSEQQRGVRALPGRRHDDFLEPRTCLAQHLPERREAARRKVEATR